MLDVGACRAHGWNLQTCWPREGVLCVNNLRSSVQFVIKKGKHGHENRAVQIVFLLTPYYLNIPELESNWEQGRMD